MVLALDFDGVICNSVEEVVQTAVETWREINPQSLIASTIGLRPEFRQAFDQLIPLGNRAEDFGVAFHILSTGLEISTQDEYDRVRTDLGHGWLSRFHTTFYQTRDRLRTGDADRWHSLHGIYPPLIEVLERRRDDTILAIATAKDGESVRSLLKHFEIDTLFSDDLILDKEIGVAKTLHLQALADRLGCRPSQITFVDDKLNHLVATAALGVRGVLAGWGHNTPREHANAHEAGFSVATLESVESVLFPP